MYVDRNDQIRAKNHKRGARVSIRRSLGNSSDVPDKRSLHWPGMKQDVYKVVKECEVCQLNKGERVASPGL